MKRRSMIGFESKNQPLLSSGRFIRRLANNLSAACVLIGVSLLVGMAGYHFLEGMAWIDAFANASMILSGMGPLGELKTWGGKLFAGLYALYSGLLLIVVAGLMFAPVVHRILHQFHLEQQDE